MDSEPLDVAKRKRRIQEVVTAPAIAPSVAALWVEQLIYASNGTIKPVLANAITALRGAPEWHGVVAYDEFSQRTVALKPAPWVDPPEVNKPWITAHDVLTADWLQRHGILVTPDVAGNAIEVVARERSFHPVRNYLNGLTWDGRHRLDRWVVGYLGVALTPYAEAVGSKWLISAVARVMQPGCKADCCLILEGPQNLGKSTALRKLAEPWFTDEVADLGTKDSSLQLGGAWILELSELDSMNRADVSKVKAYMSRNIDRFRPPYGKRVIEAPRQCVFAGTVNMTEYLRDETGGRRFWPLPCTNIDLGGIEAERDQLWAEAKDRYLAGESWWLQDAALQDAARQMQEDRYHGDPWDQKIHYFAATRDNVTIDEVLEQLQRKVGDWTQADMNRVARTLRYMGWEKRRDPVNTADDGQSAQRGKRLWRYWKPD